MPRACMTSPRRWNDEPMATTTNGEVTKRKIATTETAKWINYEEKFKN